MNSARYPSDFFFQKDNSHNCRISKPAFNAIGGWDLSSLLQKSDIACTCLAEGRKTRTAVFLTHLIPSVAFEDDSKELEAFLSTASYFKNSKGIRFIPKAAIRNFSSVVRGCVSHPRYVDGIFSAIYQCSSCGREVDPKTIDQAGAGQSEACECGNKIELKQYDIPVPALIQKYEDHLTLKQILHQAHATQASVPDKIFCHLIFSASKFFHLSLDQQLPLLISSNVILITASGRIRFIFLPTLSCSKGFVKKDIPSIIARFCEAYCHLIPDVSHELSRFLTLPNLKTMAALRARSKTVNKNDLKSFLQYIKTHRGSSAATKVDTDLTKNSRRNSSTSTLDPFDITLHPGIANRQRLEQLSQMETKRLSTQRKTKTWQRIASEERVPEQLLAAAVFHLKKTPLWQKAVSVGAVVFLAIFAIRVAVVTSREVPHASFYMSTTKTLQSFPDIRKPMLIGESIAGELSEKLEEPVATVKLQIQTDGTVKQIKWIFASEQQKSAYEKKLLELKFEPAVEKGKQISNWVPLQLPIKRKPNGK